MTPRTEEQNQALRAATRERLLQAAMRLFSRHGYEAVSVRAIAAEAAVAQGLLYSHFPGKGDLLKALFARGMDDVRESFAAAAGGEGRPPLERLIRSAFSILRRNLDFWRLSYGIRMQQGVVEALGPQLHAWTEDILRTLEGHFRAAGHRQPRVEAAILFAAIDGVSQHYALDPNRYPLDAVADALVARYAAETPAREPSRRPATPKGGSHGKPRRRPS